MSALDLHETLAKLRSARIDASCCARNTSDSAGAAVAIDSSGSVLEPPINDSAASKTAATAHAASNRMDVFPPIQMQLKPSQPSDFHGTQAF